MSRRFVVAGLLSIAALTAALPAAAQSAFVSDQFTVGANTMLEAHTPNTAGGAWTRQAGTNGIIINAAAGNARNVGAGDWSVYTNGTVAPAAEVAVGVTVTFTNANTNNFVDVFGRASTSLLQAYSVRLAAGGANNVTLSRWSGGTPTTIATATVTVALNTQIGIVLSLKNASKTVAINGVTVASSTDNVVTAAGNVAIGMQSNAAGQTITDNFFAGTFSPTAVDRLDATVTRDTTRTLIEWSTAREVQNLGFRIYRDGGNGLTLVSPGLIAGAGFMIAEGSLPAGNTYRWVDADPRAQAARAWWIEDVDLRGHGVWHGPIVARQGHLGRAVIPSPTFVDLRQREGVVTPARLRSAVLAESTAPPRRRAADPFAGPRTKQFQLAASNTIKIGIAIDGLYRVTRADLVAGGLDATIDLQALRLYADGMEEPLAIDGDAIEFYGRALDTASTSTRVYWLTSDEGAGMRMASSPPVAGAVVSERRNFLATAERRDKQRFLAFLRTPDGDNFVGPIVSTDATQPTTEILQVGHVDRSATTATLNIELQGASDAGGVVDHRVAISLNGHQAGEIAFSGMTRPSFSINVPSELLADGDNTISLAAQNGDADLSAVVSVALTYAHTLNADDDRLLAVIDGGSETTISGFSRDDVQIIDITNERAPIRIVPLRVDAGNVTFDAPGSGSRIVLAVAGPKLARAASIARNEPSALHAAEGADMVIISHQSFANALAPLVKLREEQGLRTMIVKIDDVYDEYNYGAKDPEAMRTFLQDARNWQRPPRYVLLAGDASFDPQNHLGFGDFDFVPTKLLPSDLLETASDTWFTDFDDDGAPDIPIGRLSARVADDVVTEVRKIMVFEGAAAPPQPKIMLVSDSDPDLDFHGRSVSLEMTIPHAFEVVDVDAAASGPAAARAQLMAGFRDALLVNYIGHGSIEIWSGDGLFGRDDVAALPESLRPPIVVAMTCLNGYFQDVYSDSLAETLLRAPNGAVAVWASSALTAPDEQFPVNEALLAALLVPGGVRLGDAVLAAQKSSTTPDIRKTFILFGDPALRVRANP
jgi:hypothetical protein